MLLLFKHIFHLFLIVICTQLPVKLVAQQLAFNSRTTTVEVPLSIRPVVSGYLPAYTNLLEENYDVLDLRAQLTGSTICRLPDSLLQNSTDAVLLITNEFFCGYTASQVAPGSIILVPVDSNDLATASLPHFDEEDDTFGPVYIFAISNEAMSELEQIMEELESIVFEPNGKPVFSNYSSSPTYHLAEDMVLTLPCRRNQAYSVGVTLPSDHVVEIVINADSSNIYFSGFLDFGRGFFDYKSFRYYDQLYSEDEIKFNAISGELGDHIRFKPRCEGIDSFSVSVDLEKVDTSKSCWIDAAFPFEVVAQNEVLASSQRNGRHGLNLPFDSRPIIFVSDVDSLAELPSGRPQDYKPYYAYDNWFFDLVIASDGGCRSLNADLNGGDFSSSIDESLESSINTAICSFHKKYSSYTCTTHIHADVEMLSDYIPLHLYLPKGLDVAHCKVGDQNQIVRAIEK